MPWWARAPPSLSRGRRANTELPIAVKDNKSNEVYTKENNKVYIVYIHI